jgi:hypothetical protein
LYLIFDIFFQEWTLSILFHFIAIDVIVYIHCLLLAEKSLVVVGTDSGLVSLITTSFLHLLQPFKWAGVFVPVLPPLAQEILDAPVPFLIGLVAKPNSIFQSFGKTIRPPLPISPMANVLYIDDFINYPQFYVQQSFMFDSKTVHETLFNQNQQLFEAHLRRSHSQSHLYLHLKPDNLHLKYFEKCQEEFQVEESNCATAFFTSPSPITINTATGASAPSDSGRSNRSRYHMMDYYRNHYLRQLVWKLKKSLQQFQYAMMILHYDSATNMPACHNASTVPVTESTIGVEKAPSDDKKVDTSKQRIFPFRRNYSKNSDPGTNADNKTNEIGSSTPGASAKHLKRNSVEDKFSNDGKLTPPNSFLSPSQTGKEESTKRYAQPPNKTKAPFSPPLLIQSYSLEGSTLSTPATPNSSFLPCASPWTDSTPKIYRASPHEQRNFLHHLATHVSSAFMIRKLLKDMSPLLKKSIGELQRCFHEENERYCGSFVPFSSVASQPSPSYQSFWSFTHPLEGSSSPDISIATQTEYILNPLRFQLHYQEYVCRTQMYATLFDQSHATYLLEHRSR